MTNINRQIQQLIISKGVSESRNAAIVVQFQQRSYRRVIRFS